MTTGEFAFIDRLRERVPPRDGWVGIGDDAAVLDDGLLVAVDSLVHGVHVRLDWCTPADVGWKALAVNLSDVAAMGGRPLAAVAAVTLPPEPDGLADAIADGLLELATLTDCPLVGGDTTSGDTLVVTVTVLGRAPDTGPVLRSGGQPGDTVFVTGSIGGPGHAIAALSEGRQPAAGLDRLHRPMPRLAAGQAAAAAGASAMIDVSDGLVADLAHIAAASGCGFRIDSRSLPVPGGVEFIHALRGGDDYELVICTHQPELLLTDFEQAGLTAPVPIGLLTESGAEVVDPAGRVMAIPTEGFQHRVG